MKKCGLKRAYAQGGVLPDQMQNIGSDNPINAEREARWRMDEVESKMKYAADPNQEKALGGLWNSMNKDYTAKFAGDRTLPPPPGALAAQQEEASVLRAFNKMMGFRQGGTVGVDQRGFIEGPGGVDNVPARIDETGEEIRVGAGERIVNKKQNAALEALAAQAGMSLDEYLEASTQEPVGPTMKKGLRAAQNGGTFERAGQWLKDKANAAFKGATTAAGNLGQNKAYPTWTIPNDLKPLQPITSTAAQPNPSGINPARTRVNVTVDAKHLVDLKRKAAQEAAQEAKKFGKYYRSATQAGQAFKASPIYETLKSAKPSKVGVGTGALMAGLEIGDSFQFMGDENVSDVDKARQLGRITLRSAGALGGTAFGAGVGSVAGPVGTLAGGAAVGTAGHNAGDWLGEQIFGNPMEGYGNKPQAQGQAKPTPIPFEQLPQSDPSYDRKEFRSAAGNVAARQELDNPNIAGLRAAGVTGAVMGDVTEGGRTPATRIRTIDTQHGKVYAGRDAKGQLVVNSNVNPGGLAAADAARDKEFAAKGYAKDGYGNWITPQRIADKQALAQIQSDRAKFNAFSDQVNDPRARAAGLRKVMFDTKQQELEVHKAAADKAARVAEMAERRAMLAEEREQRRMGADERAARNAELKEIHSLIDQWYTENGEVNAKDAMEFKTYISQFDLNNVLGPDGKPLDRIQALTEAKKRFDARRYVNGNAGGSKTYRDISPVGVDKAGFRDLIRPGNKVFFPGQEVVVYDNNARISPRVVDERDLDTQNALGLTNLDQLRQR